MYRGTSVCIEGRVCVWREERDRDYSNYEVKVL